MKAVVQEKYGLPGEVLTVREVAKPVVRDNEVLVRVRAASVHPDVWHVVTGLPYMLRLMGNGVFGPKKRIPGSDLAGTVEAIGKNVTRLKVGDDVFGESVKFGWHNGGAFAEYAAVPEELLVLKPGNITFEQAAAVPTPGYIALSNLEGVEAGHNVLINGAGGCMGLLAIPIAKARGARVTAVDCGEKLELMRSVGADEIIDYTKEDFLKSGERYDFILDIASNLWFDVCEPVLAPSETYQPIGHANFGKATGRMGGKIVGSLPAFVGIMARMMLDPKKRQKFKMLKKLDAMTQFQQLIESGKLTPVVGKALPLGEVRAAMREMEAGNVLGRIILIP